MSLKKINTAVLGATGYTGLDLVLLLSKHPKVNINYLFATKNLYWDISKSSILFKILYLLYILITKLIIKFLSEKSLLRFRKFAVSIYSYCFGIKKNSSFKLSERTINCLVNNNSSSANEAIKIIKTYQKKIKYSQRLENIIVEDIF